MKLHTTNPQLLTAKNEEQEIQVLGGIKIHQLDTLRVTLKITHEENHPLRFRGDLYNMDVSEKLIRTITSHFEQDIKQVRTDIMSLIDQLETYRLKALEQQEQTKTQTKELTEEEKKQAIQYLKKPKLMERLSKDISQVGGIVGEENNALLLYIALSSKRSPYPMSTIITGESGSGKTTLLQGVAKTFPEEDIISLTSLSKTSLYYMTDLIDKILLIEDLTGARDEEVLFALREITSNQKLSRSTTEKDPQGNTISKVVTLKTQLAIASCTTEETYNDNDNRSIGIHIENHNPDKTQQIIHYKQSLSSGKEQINPEQQSQLQNIHRVLQPQQVRNPYANQLALPSTVKNAKRAYQIYLNTINTIALLHQYQRKTHKDQDQSYIQVKKEDIHWANKLLLDTLISKSDELSTPARKFYQRLREELRERGDKNFTIRDIKEYSHLSNIKRYLKELREYQLIRIQSGNRYTGYEYKLLEGKDWEELLKDFQKELQEQETQLAAQ